MCLFDFVLMNSTATNHRIVSDKWTVCNSWCTCWHFCEDVGLLDFENCFNEFRLWFVYSFICVSSNFLVSEFLSFFCLFLFVFFFFFNYYYQYYYLNIFVVSLSALLSYLDFSSGIGHLNLSTGYCVRCAMILFIIIILIILFFNKLCTCEE